MPISERGRWTPGKSTTKGDKANKRLLEVIIRTKTRKAQPYTLRTRRLRGDLIETYKIITGKENIKSENFFRIYSNGYDTSGYFKLATTRSRLELRCNFFSQWVVSTWNSLTAHVIEADTVNYSKNRLDAE